MLVNQSHNSELIVEAPDDGGLMLVTCIPDDVLSVITVVNFVVVSGIIGACGLVFNVVNVVIFARLGFKDTSNISFFALSLANAGVVLMLLGCSVMENPLLLRVALYVDLADAVGYLTFGWSYTFFSRISGGMTAAITAERFICVATPLKVRTFLTKKVTVAVTLTVFVVPIAMTTPAFLAYTLGPVYYQALNRTVLGLVPSQSSAQLESFAVLGYMSTRLLLYALVTIFTIALTRSFLHKTQWRNSAAAASISSFNTRDKRLVKTVITLSTLFIILSSPVVILSLMIIFIPEFKVTGRYKNLFIALFSTFYPIDGLNSTATFFIFLDMSSKYRRELRELLPSSRWSKLHSRNKYFENLKHRCSKIIR